MSDIASEILTIPVDPESAKIYRSAAPERQRMIQALLDMWLKDSTSSDPRHLKTVMDKIGREARQRGLTPEILETILRET
jgi:hypothetical protein